MNVGYTKAINALDVHWKKEVALREHLSRVFEASSASLARKLVLAAYLLKLYDRGRLQGPERVLVDSFISRASRGNPSLDKALKDFLANPHGVENKVSFSRRDIQGRLPYQLSPLVTDTIAHMENSFSSPCRLYEREVLSFFDVSTPQGEELATEIVSLFFILAIINSIDESLDGDSPREVSTIFTRPFGALQGNVDWFGRTVGRFGLKVPVRIIFCQEEELFLSPRQNELLELSKATTFLSPTVGWLGRSRNVEAFGTLSGFLCARFDTDFDDLSADTKAKILAFSTLSSAHALFKGVLEGGDKIDWRYTRETLHIRAFDLVNSERVRNGFDSLARVVSFVPGVSTADEKINFILSLFLESVGDVISASGTRDVDNSPFFSTSFRQETTPGIKPSVSLFLNNLPVVARQIEALFENFTATDMQVRVKHVYDMIKPQALYTEETERWAGGDSPQCVEEALRSGSIYRFGREYLFGDMLEKIEATIAPEEEKLSEATALSAAEAAGSTLSWHPSRSLRTQALKEANNKFTLTKAHGAFPYIHGDILDYKGTAPDREFFDSISRIVHR